MELIRPASWPVWIAMGLLWLVVQLPFRTQAPIGRGMGRLLYRLAGKRRGFAATNLQLCLPELSDETREWILQKNFEHIGLSLLESGLAWWGSTPRLRALSHVKGIEHVTKAVADGKGVLILNGHTTSIEIGAQLLALALADAGLQLGGMYKRAHNPVIERLMYRGRTRYSPHLFRHSEIRRLLAGLRNAQPFWYAPDQDFGLKQGVFAPFFGVPTATLTTTAKLVQRTGAVLIPCAMIRLPDEQGFEIELFPPLEGYPSGDKVADATRTNAVLEEIVRTHPAQYLWLHRRFKTRPAGLPPLYGPRQPGQSR